MRYRPLLLAFLFIFNFSGGLGFKALVEEEEWEEFSDEFPSPEKLLEMSDREGAFSKYQKHLEDSIFKFLRQIMIKNQIKTENELLAFFLTASAYTDSQLFAESGIYTKALNTAVSHSFKNYNAESLAPLSCFGSWLSLSKEMQEVHNKLLSEVNIIGPMIFRSFTASVEHMKKFLNSGNQREKSEYYISLYEDVCSLFPENLEIKNALKRVVLARKIANLRVLHTFAKFAKNAFEEAYLEVVKYMPEQSFQKTPLKNAETWIIFVKRLQYDEERSRILIPWAPIFTWHFERESYLALKQIAPIEMPSELLKLIYEKKIRLILK